VGDDPNRQAYRYLRQTASVGDRHHIQFDADCSYSFLLHPFIGLILGGLAPFLYPCAIDKKQNSCYGYYA